MPEKLIQLKWTRPNAVEYPKVWRTFQARDLDSDKLVEYRVQDLPESHFEIAIEHMVEHFMRDEPTMAILDAVNDPDHINTRRLAYHSLLPQRAALACFRADSDELVGLCMGFVVTRGEDFYFDACKRTKSASANAQKEICKIPYDANSFDPFEHYGVEIYYSELGLSVDARYRGRNIGYEILAARKDFCQAVGIKLDHMTFSSDFSNKIADKLGFELNVSMSYEEIDKLCPGHNIKNINAKEFTVKSMICY